MEVFGWKELHIKGRVLILLSVYLKYKCSDHGPLKIWERILKITERVEVVAWGSRLAYFKPLFNSFSEKKGLNVFLHS